MNHESKRPITVEDLLQLKRAERPSAEFWTGFERDLRAKQLAALVEKRAWWRTTPRIFAGFSRYHLPLGATAILALTFLSVRDYRAVTPEDSISPAQHVPSAPAVAALAPVAQVAADPLREFVVEAPAINAVDLASASNEAVGNSDSANSGRVPHSSALFDTVSDSAAFATPSARTITANFAAAQAADPDLARRFPGVIRGFESRMLPARAPAVEPLAQMTPPSESRRSRMTAFAMPASYNSVARGSEKIASKISDDQLYESLTASRFDARGDRFKVKF